MMFPDIPKGNWLCDYNELERLIAFSQKFGRLYIYGAGERCQYLAKFLSMVGISINGFVTTDTDCSPMVDAEFHKYTIDALDLSDTGIILGLSQDFYSQVIPLLYSKGFYNFHMITENMRNAVLYTLRRRSQKNAHITVNIIDHCNLRCRYCDHFSQLVHKPKLMSIEQFVNDVKRLKELCPTLGILSIEGGEPLLHPDIVEFMKAARDIYGGKTTISVVTNGIKLGSMGEEFYDAARENNITMFITKYPIDTDYEAVTRKLNSEGVPYLFYLDPYSSNAGEKHMRKFPFDLSGNQPDYNWMGCMQFNNASALYNGRLYTCTLRPNVHYFNERFDKSLPLDTEDSIDIYKARDWEEISSFLSEPIPFCRYCDVKHRLEPQKWERSKQDISEFLSG